MVVVFVVVVVVVAVFRESPRLRMEESWWSLLLGASQDSKESHPKIESDLYVQKKLGGKKVGKSGYLGHPCSNQLFSLPCWSSQHPDQKVKEADLILWCA